MNSHFSMTCFPKEYTSYKLGTFLNLETSVSQSGEHIYTFVLKRNEIAYRSVHMYLSVKSTSFFGFWGFFKYAIRVEILRIN